MRSLVLGLLAFGSIAALTIGCGDDSGDDTSGISPAQTGGSSGAAGAAGTAGTAGASGAAGMSGGAGTGGTAGVGGSAGGGNGGMAGADGGTAGNGGSAGEGGSGTGGTGGDDGGTAGTGGVAGSAGAAGNGGSGGNPVCDDAQKRCGYQFTYAYNNETSVEVRDDYKAGGWTSGTPMTHQGNQWVAVVDEIPWGTDFQYKFVINGTNWVPDPSNPNTVSDGYGGVNSVVNDLTCTAWTCDTTIPPQNDWADSVMYFVFVDRFLDGNSSNNPPVGNTDLAAQYRGGDWAGVKTKINEGYFNDLGVNTLWISAPMDNTNSLGAGQGGDSHMYTGYHGYWPSNLEQPEEHFGSMQELKDVVSAAHAKGLKVVVDYVMNHVHQDSPIYQQHKNDGWFWPMDNCICGAGCSWDGAEGKKCWFTDYLPDFNFTNADARGYSVGNAVWWVQQTGIDGFRLDAVKHIEDQWLLDIRQRIKTEIESTTNTHFYMVGETFTGDRSTIKYYVRPDMLDGQFEFPLRITLINALLTRTADMQSLDSDLATYESYYGSSSLMSTFIGNHDVPRSIHFADDSPIAQNAWYDGKDRAWNNQPGLPAGTSAFERLANAFTVLFTIKGVPLVYYGDEVGMPGAGDPDNRRPMQWSGDNDGQQLLLDRIKKLGAARKAHEALRRGTRTTLTINKDTILYRMQSNADTVWVAINRSDSTQGTGGLPSGSYTDLISGQTVQGPSLSLPARSSMVLVAK